MNAKLRAKNKEFCFLMMFCTQELPRKWYATFLTCNVYSFEVTFLVEKCKNHTQI